MRIIPTARFDALARFDNSNDRRYEEFMQGVMQVIETKTSRFFMNEYRYGERGHIVNLITKFVGKLIESINNEKSNLFYIWLDAVNIIDENFDPDYFLDNVTVEDMYTSLEANTMYHIAQIIKQNNHEDDLRKGEIILMYFSYVLIPKKIPINIIQIDT